MKSIKLMAAAGAMAFAVVGLGASAAQAASCSGFAIIKSFDKATSMAKVEWTKGDTRKYFPQVEGASGDIQKIPGKCKRKVTKEDTFLVRSDGGRMSITQFRENFSGKMINDVEDESWVPTNLVDLITKKEMVLIVIRPGMGKDAPLGLTTVYLPITDAELKEIDRLNKQAEDT